jgi:hypothetical protein
VPRGVGWLLFISENFELRELDREIWIVRFPSFACNWILRYGIWDLRFVRVEGKEKYCWDFDGQISCPALPWLPCGGIFY